MSSVSAKAFSHSIYSASLHLCKLMALAPSINFKFYQSPFCSRNPNFKLKHSRFSLRFPDNHPRFSSSISEWKLRHRFFVCSNSGEDPAQSCLEDDDDDDDDVNSVAVKAALSMLRFYKREISPLLPKSCRYIPTCSEYSMIAYKNYGFMKGTILTACRLCRCNPLGSCGFDPPRWFDEPTPRKP